MDAGRYKEGGEVNERRIMKGRLVELEEKAKAIEVRMRMNCDGIGVRVNPRIFGLQEMPGVEAAALRDELVLQQAELMRLGSQIAELRDALYG